MKYYKNLAKEMGVDTKINTVHLGENYFIRMDYKYEDSYIVEYLAYEGSCGYGFVYSSEETIEDFKIEIIEKIIASLQLYRQNCYLSFFKKNGEILKLPRVGDYAWYAAYATKGESYIETEMIGLGKWGHGVAESSSDITLAPGKYTGKLECIDGDGNILESYDFQFEVWEDYTGVEQDVRVIVDK